MTISLINHPLFTMHGTPQRCSQKNAGFSRSPVRTTKNFSSQDGNRTVAFITKGWAGGAQELFTSANSFYVAGLGWGSGVLGCWGLGFWL